MVTLVGFVLVLALLAVVEWAPVGPQVVRYRWSAMAAQPPTVDVAPVPTVLPEAAPLPTPESPALPPDGALAPPVAPPA